MLLWLLEKHGQGNRLEGDEKRYHGACAGTPWWPQRWREWRWLTLARAHRQCLRGLHACPLTKTPSSPGRRVPPAGLKRHFHINQITVCFLSLAFSAFPLICLLIHRYHVPFINQFVDFTCLFSEPIFIASWRLNPVLETKGVAPNNRITVEKYSYLPGAYVLMGHLVLEGVGVGKAGPWASSGPLPLLFF